jgi:hypothetical protein
VSYPKPTVEWRTYTGRGWTVQQDSVQYKYILTSFIEVKDESDFKRYVFTIVNQLGSVELNISTNLVLKFQVNWKTKTSKNILKTTIETI